MTETGKLAAALPDESDEDTDTPADPSRLASAVKLIRLCTEVAKGQHGFALFRLAKTQGHFACLDLHGANAHIEG